MGSWCCRITFCLVPTRSISPCQSFSLQSVAHFWLSQRGEKLSLQCYNLCTLNFCLHYPTYPLTHNGHVPVPGPLHLWKGHPSIDLVPSISKSQFGTLKDSSLGPHYVVRLQNSGYQLVHLPSNIVRALGRWLPLHFLVVHQSFEVG